MCRRVSVVNILKALTEMVRHLYKELLLVELVLSSNIDRGDRCKLELILIIRVYRFVIVCFCYMVK